MQLLKKPIDATSLSLALGLGTFIQVLDTSIANVAIPYIAGNLGVSADEGTWVITAFAASNAIMLPLTGWLSNYFGRIKLFVWSVLLFSFASFCCGFASSLTMLVIFRVIQGAVAGSLIPLSQSILMANNPKEAQGAALGFWSMIVIVAPVLGPIIGGYLTEVYSWPWIFYINVPIGLFSAGVTWFMLKDRDSPIVRNPIDWIGLGLLSCGVACLQIMLDKGKDLDWFDSNVIVCLTLISIISLIYFVIWNQGQKFPIVDFSFFKSRNYAVGLAITTIGYLIYFTSSVTLPLWLQTEQAYTPFWAGVAVAPVGLVSMMLSMFVGRSMDRFDLRWTCALSFFFFACSLFYQSAFTTEVSLDDIMLARFYQGFGLVIFFLPLLRITFAEIAPPDLPSASGLFHFVRILVGSGFGTSLAIELWSYQEIFHHARLAEAITSYSTPTMHFYRELNASNPIFSSAIVTRIIDQQVEKQAYMLSTNDLSWLGAWLFLIMIPFIFLCRNTHPGGSAPTGEHG